ncbi:MAG: hypothetical protein COB37_04265, partial [Kordiimonadales bacterium]
DASNIEAPVGEAELASDPFDPSQIAFIFEDNWAEGMSLMQHFIVTISEKASEARASLGENNLPDARELIHAAKGAAGSIGAVHLFAKFKRIERNILSSDGAAALELFVGLDELLVEFEEAVTKTFPERAGENSGS